jgi:hypothetical protein
MTICRHVGAVLAKKLLIILQYYANQINNRDAVVALGDETAARWRLGRRFGQQLKVTAALGHGGRYATRASTSRCDERGGRRTGKSYSTINYLKLNATTRTQRDGT